MDTYGDYLRERREASIIEEENRCFRAMENWGERCVNPRKHIHPRLRNGTRRG